MTLTPLAVAGTALAAGAALLLSPAAAVSSPLAAAHTEVIPSCNHATYEPTTYVLACADGNTQIHHAAYTAWHRSYALGHGTYVYNTCSPSCADGTFKHHRVAFSLGRVRTVGKQRLFTRMFVSYAGLTETFDLGRG